MLIITKLVMDHLNSLNDNTYRVWTFIVFKNGILKYITMFKLKKSFNEILTRKIGIEKGID